jgi:hypothetical protein
MYECSWNTNIVNFQTSYITKVLQLYNNIVIDYELEPPYHRRETKEPLSSHEILLMPKAILLLSIPYYIHSDVYGFTIYLIPLILP